MDDDRRDDEQHERQAERDPQGSVAVAHQRSDALTGAAEQPRAEAAPLSAGRQTRGEPDRIELCGRAEQRHVIPGVDAQVTPGADDRGLLGLAGHPQRHEGAIQLTQGRVVWHLDLGRDEVGRVDRDVVRPALQARLDHRRCKQRRHVEHRRDAADLLDRSRDGRVVEVRHEPDVSPQIVHQQDRLERPQIRRLDHDHGLGVGHPCLEQGIGHISAPLDDRDRPIADDARLPLAHGLVVDHHDLGAGQVQLLDGAHPDRLQTADDHMAAPFAPPVDDPRPAGHRFAPF